MKTAAKRGARDDAQIETGTIRGEDAGEEGTVGVDGKGEAAGTVEIGGKAGTTTDDKT
jgi:hypothetical protein